MPFKNVPVTSYNPAPQLHARGHTGTIWHKLGTIPGFAVERPNS